MKKTLILALLLLAGTAAYSQDITAYMQEFGSMIEKPEVMDPATIPVYANAASVRAQRQQAVLSGFPMIPALLSAQTMISLYKNGDHNDVWGKYLDSVEKALESAKKTLIEPRSTFKSDQMHIGPDFSFTIGEVAGMSDAELNAWGMQAAEARLGEFGLSLSDLHEGMTEEEAMALAGKIMEAQYGGINMEELQKYMNSDMEGRENMTMEAVEEMNEKTIRTNSLRYIDMSIAQKRMEINAVIENKIMPKFREAEEKESIGLVSIRLYHDASVNAITVCKSELVPLYLDLAAFMDLGYAINQHTEYALREETPFAPLLYAFGIAQGLKSHPQPPLD